MSFTPFNAPLLSGFLGDMEIASRFSVKADIAAMLKFEAALASSQAQAGLILTDHAEKIAEVCESFEPDMSTVQQGVIRDGMAVPELVRQLRIACDGETAASLHYGATSQDAIDTSFVLRLVSVNQILRGRLAEALALLNDLERKFGPRSLMARTRMQAALPVTVAHRVQQWRDPLAAALASMDEIEKQLHVIQLGGPVGDLAKMGDKGDEIREKLSTLLGLGNPDCAWHTDRSRIVAYCNWLSLLCGAIGKIGQDAALMAQNEMGELQFESAGTSSAMAHKQNPVMAEVLVTLARFAASLNAGMQHNHIHEQERSGISWTYEWMVLPQLCVVTGAALRNVSALLNSITGLGKENFTDQ